MFYDPTRSVRLDLTREKALNICGFGIFVMALVKKACIHTANPYRYIFGLSQLEF